MYVQMLLMSGQSLEMVARTAYLKHEVHNLEIVFATHTVSVSDVLCKLCRAWSGCPSVG